LDLKSDYIVVKYVIDSIEKKFVNVKVEFQMCSPNVEEGEGEKTHGHGILLASTK